MSWWLYSNEFHAGLKARNSVERHYARRYMLACMSHIKHKWKYEFNLLRWIMDIRQGCSVMMI